MYVPRIGTIRPDERAARRPTAAGPRVGRGPCRGRRPPRAARAARPCCRSVAEATVTLFDAEAASIALHDAASDRLVIRVAAGTAGEGAVGLVDGLERGHRRVRVHDGPAAGRERRGRGPALRPVGGRGDRVRPALDPRRAARRRRRHDRRARGARPPRRRRVRAARHRARGGVRPPGDGRDPVEPGRARRGRAAARDAGGARAADADAGADVDEAIDAAVGVARRRRRTACGRSPTPSRALAPRRRARSPWSSTSSTRSPAARRARRRARSGGDRRPPRLERAVRRPATGTASCATGRGAARTARGRSATGRGARAAGRDRGFRRRGRAPGGRRPPRRERRGRARRRRAGGSYRRHAGGRRRPRDGVRGDRPRASRRDAEIVSVRVLGGDNRGNGGGVRDGPRVGDRGVGGVGRQPVALLAQRRLLRPAPRARRRGLLPERAAGLGRQQPRRRELPLAVRGGRVGRRPRRAERGGLVLQPGAAGRVRGARAQRRRRLAGRRRG